MRAIENITTADLQALRDSGLTLDEIGAHAGISKSSVFRRLSSAPSAIYRRKQVDRISDDQLAECRLDPKWEPRNTAVTIRAGESRIVRVVCRECGEIKKSALNFPDGGHLRCRHALSSEAYLNRYPHAPLCPQKLVPCVSYDQLDDCRFDPAWEARRGISDQVVCRECGQLVRIQVTSHLRSEHGISSDDYLKKYPSARLFTFDQSVKANGRSSNSWGCKRTAAELMRRMAEDFVCAQELRECRQDPLWEWHQGITTFSVCRKCGFKSRCAMTAHLKTHYRTGHRLQHGEMTHAYHADYPGAPTAAPADSPNRRGLNAAYDRRKAKLQKLLSRGRQPNTWVVKRAIELRSEGKSWDELADVINKETGTFIEAKSYKMAVYRYNKKKRGSVQRGVIS